MVTIAALLLSSVLGRSPAPRCVEQAFVLRGKTQQLHVCGDPSGPPAIVSSGDGGWLRLAPHVANVLAGHGFHVIGVDTKSYLRSFTGGGNPLTVDQVAGDFGQLVSFASGNTHAPPVLVGVSEGAALSVVAGAAEILKRRIAGVITLGLGDINELAWHWTDSVIYITKGVPNEPSFRASVFVPLVTPLPLALIRSTHDEYVPWDEAQQLAQLAKEPKRVWTIAASDHAFSNNRRELDRRLLEAVAWTAAHRSAVIQSK